MADTAEVTLDSKQWDNLLKKVRARYKDIEQRKQWGGLASAIVFRDIMDHFRKEEGPDGKWADWSHSYMQAIAGLVAFRYSKALKRVIAITDDDFLSKNKPPRKPGKKLQVTGNLRTSFTPSSWRAQREGLMFFNKAKTSSGFPYAYAHDTGGPKLPQRKFMWLSKKGMNSLARQTVRWLSGDNV
jgi:phage gpG-like protein